MIAPRRTPLALYGREVVVVGFGPVSQGVAARARDLGVVVTVVDLDRVRLVQANTTAWRSTLDVDRGVEIESGR